MLTRTSNETEMLAYLEGASIGKRTQELVLFNSYDKQSALEQAIDESEATLPQFVECTSTTGPLFRLGIEAGKALVLQSVEKYEVAHV